MATAQRSQSVTPGPRAADGGNRRSFLRGFPQAAIVFSAASAFGTARGSEPKPTEIQPLGGTGSEWETPASTRAAATGQVTATPRRAQPLPTPPEDERAWLQEWLDLIELPRRRAISGC